MPKTAKLKMQLVTMLVHVTPVVIALGHVTYLSLPFRDVN